jgi:hypothetical protein
VRTIPPLDVTGLWTAKCIIGNVKAAQEGAVSAGSEKLIVVPLAGALSAQIRPPCCSTRCLLMARPRPTPALLRVWSDCRYKLSLRDLAEIFLERGSSFTHEAVREWEARFAPLLAVQLRAKRQGQPGGSWYVDETHLFVGS